MKVIEVAFHGYPVTDLPRARAFYEKVLGLRPSDVYGESDVRGGVEYEIGPHTLLISNLRLDVQQPSPYGGMAALEMEDFDAAVTELKAAGVRFDVEPIETPVCRMAIIRDPDGNRLCVHKRHPRAGA